jgi:hypothetical protein
MFHAINARLARQARRIQEIGLAHDNTAALAQGWQAREIKPGTWRYRDPRFGLLVASTGPGKGLNAKICDRIAAALENGDRLTVIDAKNAPRRSS